MCIDALPDPSPAPILRGAAPWPALAPLAQALARQWVGVTPGIHRFAFEDSRVLLSLCVGDTREMLREQAFTADSVFLDMADAVADMPPLKAVARLCRRGTTLAAGPGSADAQALRSGLVSCGFVPRTDAAVSAPTDGDSGLHAVFDPAWTPRGPVATAPHAPHAARTPGRAAVIGGGLAGAAVAASLERRGWQVQVLDSADAPAAGASALPAGLLAPHTSPDDNLLSRLSRAGVRMTLQQAHALLRAGVDWSPCGALEQRLDDHRALPALGGTGHDWQCDAASLPEPPAHAQPGAVWHALAACVRPGALVHAWLAQPGITWRGGCPVAALRPAQGGWDLLDAAGHVLAHSDIAVVATALDSAGLLASAAAHLPPPTLNPVRGQVSWAPHAASPPALPPLLPAHALNGHGHFIPCAPVGGEPAWFCGSTYGRGEQDTAPRAADHAANLQRLQALAPQLGAALAPLFDTGRVQTWTGVRCTSRDRRPLVGEWAPGLWLSTALGSRGLTFAALCAELMAARLHGEPLPLPQRLAQALDVRRVLPGS